jgi:hypothetical protein
MGVEVVVLGLIEDGYGRGLTLGLVTRLDLQSFDYCRVLQGGRSASAPFGVGSVKGAVVWKLHFLEYYFRVLAASPLPHRLAVYSGWDAAVLFALRGWKQGAPVLGGVERRWGLLEGIDDALAEEIEAGADLREYLYVVFGVV